jgi:hypothetical protein
VADRLRKELGIEVALEKGPYGRATVLVDGVCVAQTGLSGWLPRTSVVVARVREALGAVAMS